MYNLPKKQQQQKKKPNEKKRRKIFVNNAANSEPRNQFRSDEPEENYCTHLNEPNPSKNETHKTQNTELKTHTHTHTRYSVLFLCFEIVHNIKHHS